MILNFYGWKLKLKVIWFWSDCKK